MERSTLSFAFLLMGIICMTACKKKDKTQEEEPVPQVTVTDPPPSTGDYWLTTRNTSQIYWTQDFATYHEVSGKLKGERIFVSGDTVLFSGNSDFSVHYAPVSNPADFKTVSSSRVVSSAAFAHGYVVTISTDGNNRYIGYCNTRKGETEIKYTLLNGSESFSELFKIRNFLISNFSTNLGITMAFSHYVNDSLKWMFAPSPYVNSNMKYYDGGSGITVAHSGMIYKTSGIDLSTATWTSKDIISTNTTDSAGVFYPYNIPSGDFMNINGKWKIYGSITMASNGHRLHAVNTSGDQGQTWQTTLLTGVPYLTGSGNSFQYWCLASKTTTFILCSSNSGPNSPAYVYKSTDGVNFTKILEGSDAMNVYSQIMIVKYVK